jgi:hypothetical protein
VATKKVKSFYDAINIYIRFKSDDRCNRQDADRK